MQSPLEQHEVLPPVWMANAFEIGNQDGEVNNARRRRRFHLPDEFVQTFSVYMYVSIRPRLNPQCLRFVCLS